MDSKHRIIEPFLVVLMYYGLIPARRADGSTVIFRAEQEEPEQDPKPGIPEKPQKTGGFLSRLFGRKKA